MVDQSAHVQSSNHLGKSMFSDMGVDGGTDGADEEFEIFACNIRASVENLHGRWVP